MKSRVGTASIRSLGGELYRRLLLLVFYWDISGSMRGDRIESLNFATDAVVKLLQSRKKERQGFDLRLLAVTFGEQARIAIPMCPIDLVSYSNLSAVGTDTLIGPAFDLVADEYDRVQKELGVSPVEVVVTDGKFRDDFLPKLARLKKTSYGSKARRMAVAIGDDADRKALLEYVGPEGLLLTADSPEEIVNAIVEGVSQSVSGVLRSVSGAGFNVATAPLGSGSFPHLVSSVNA